MRIDSATGEAVNAGSEGSMLEMFRSENAPRTASSSSSNQSLGTGSGGGSSDSATQVVAKPKTRSEKKQTKKKVDSLF